MSRFVQTGLACAALALAVLAAPGPAGAGIKCQGEFQVTKYGLLATPYCGEEQIAKVAQSYGWKVTASEVHNNPLTKVNLCQHFGNDVRLKGACAGYSPDAYGGR